MKFQMFQLDLEKAEEPGIKLPTSVWSSKKQENTRKPLLLLYWLQQSLTLYITTNCGIFKRWEYQTSSPASWEICMQVKKQHFKSDLEQQTCSKSGEYIKAVYHHSAYLTSMQSTSRKMPDWMKHKLESRLPRKISITSDMQMTPPLWQKAKKN